MRTRKPAARFVNGPMWAIAAALSLAALSVVPGCPGTPVPDGNESDNGNVNDNDNDNGSVENGFIGSDTCLGCHADKNTFWDTGHPFKLNEVVGGEPPEYPVTTVTDPPEGLEWGDVSYVIGGFRYKYLVVDNDGFVVLGPTAQFDFPTSGFSGYNTDDGHTAPDGTPGPWDTDIGREPYDCGSCHTTGYDAEIDNRRGLEGLVGDWEFDGIHCEECHGPGADHQQTPPSAITAEPQTDAVCGRCHTRFADGIAASGGFVRHHAQWDEFSRSRHGEVMTTGCITCHDVHRPIFDSDHLAGIQALAAADGDDATLDLLPSPPGIIAECSDCHPSTSVSHAGPDTCVTCHMAFTTKSAVATGPNSGDIRSHAWLINSDPEAMAFTDADGNPVPRDGAVAFSALSAEGRPFITLDFACLRCHQDKNVDWAAGHAGDIHGG